MTKNKDWRPEDFAVKASDAERLARALAALRRIARFPDDPANREMTFSAAVDEMAAIAWHALVEQKEG